MPVVRKWRGRFAHWGWAGPEDRARSGKPHTHDEAFRQRVLTLLEQPPPPGQSTWDGVSVAVQLGVNPHAVWRGLQLLLGLGIQNNRLGMP